MTTLDELRWLAEAAGWHKPQPMTMHPAVVLALLDVVAIAKALYVTHGYPCGGCEATREYESARARLDAAMKEG